MTVADTLFWIPEPAYRCFFGMLPMVYGVALRFSPLSTSAELPPKQLGRTCCRSERNAGKQQQMMLT